MNTPILTTTLPDGRQVNYVDRRFISGPEKFSAIGYYVVEQGDRPDLLANDVYGDPELFWQLADANTVVFPTELTEVVGSRVRITLPEGVETAEDSDA
ncbi:MAG: baseplate wedge protein 53 [Armatimonadetes bacterium]|nr:LysM domain-containing protein [Armatimonadota bacterium]MBS1703835.1 baseplate wedge protein 53 [Armatimonadota bacterium]MBS1726207.1 baseplate wedge protein 53 [Armatimonadota bacterium]